MEVLYQRIPETGSFRFRIDDVFSIQGRGVAVTGQITQGRIHKGDIVDCVTTGGRRFSCLVWEIEQLGPEPKPEFAEAGDQMNGYYGLWVAEHQPGEFQPGDYLISSETKGP